MRSCFSGQILKAGIDIRVTSRWVPEQSASHHRLLDSPGRETTPARFDAIVVPTNRPAQSLASCMQLALETRIPLIVICSKLARSAEVIGTAETLAIEAYALDLPAHGSVPWGIAFRTTDDAQLAAACSVTIRDLSTKRNLGLVLARMLGWQRLMFLDDDIYGISRQDVDALAAGLSDHSVSVLIPDEFPDNSVVCHAHRLGGGEQGKFAGAGAMGVRCDRDDLAFFPNIYNDDWFFFFEEAANREIIKVGESKQRKYDPYADPDRAAKEEFGDLLAEGLYVRLDHERGLQGTDVSYWTEFIEQRQAFHAHVAESLGRHDERDDDTAQGREVRAAEMSIRAAQQQLEGISAELCHKFVELWQADLVEWRKYLTALEHFDSAGNAFQHLMLDYAESLSPRIR
jgi:hypothetical protein